jgi:hypothetical protein
MSRSRGRTAQAFVAAADVAGAFLLFEGDLHEI